jgi:hypothetical protein
VIEWGSRNTQRYAAIIVTTIIIVTQIMNSIYLYYFSPSTFKIPNIFHAPIETVPFDNGWIGFAFILVNGLLLSYVLVKDKADTTERLLLSIGLGFGVTYTVMILIGILWEISLFTVILTQMSLFIILIIAAFRRGLKLNLDGFSSLKKNGHIPRFSLLEVVMLIAMGIFVVVAIYQTVAYPSMEWDSLAYGVNYAKIIFENGKIPLIAGSSIGIEMSASYPPGVQLLAVDLYVFAGKAVDFYFRILQPIFGLATMLATYKFAMSLTKNRTAAVFAAFALSSMSTFWELFIHETYLIALTFMLTLSAFFFFKAYNASDSEDAGKYELAGTLFCCFSALTSYMGLFSFGLLLLYSVNRKVSVKRFISLAILALVVIMPWYIRNFVLLGNPLFPFLGFGNYLDPLLFSSSTQHFQNWAHVPFFSLFSTICRVGAVILGLAVVYFTFAKRRQFHLILPFYLFLIGLAIMAVHIPFVRYLIIALPALAVLLAASAKRIRPPHASVERVTSIILISLVLFSSVLVLPAINSIKPTPTGDDDKWSYLSEVFEEGEAWHWINENTPKDARIATYDIKYYYIERGIFALDGNEAAPLYKMDTIEESVDFLRENNVTYILSVPWAAPLDLRMPPAYKWCVLTRYLSDPQYLPPVYVGSKGAAVYHVGALEEETAYASFTQENLVPPMKQLTVNVTVTNATSPASGKFHIPVPVDYREGLMMVSVNSSKHLVSTELWQGIIPEVVTNPSGTYVPLVQWPVQPAGGAGFENPSFVWRIDKWGYFTFFVINQEETYEESFNVTVNIRVYNYWDIQSLFISEGPEAYSITSFDEMLPLLKTLYIQTNETSILNINSMTNNKKISLEVYSGFIPNTVINWSEQYGMVTRQPSLNNNTGEVNPSIQNLQLPKGWYSILAVYRDSYTEQVDISLEIELTVP